MSWPRKSVRCATPVHISNHSTQHVRLHRHSTTQSKTRALSREREGMEQYQCSRCSRTKDGSTPVTRHIIECTLPPVVRLRVGSKQASQRRPSCRRATANTAHSPHGSGQRPPVHAGTSHRATTRATPLPLGLLLSLSPPAFLPLRCVPCRCGWLAAACSLVRRGAGTVRRTAGQHTGGLSADRQDTTMRAAVLFVALCALLAATTGVQAQVRSVALPLRAATHQRHWSGNGGQRAESSSANAPR
jgi:hypothetical protein